jgi:hypothetical protein
MNTVIIDGAANIHVAFKKEFTINNPRTRQISHFRLQGNHKNNKMERLDDGKGIFGFIIVL